MLLSRQPEQHYTRAPVHEVICQLRFPTILMINTTDPADFQEAIRDEFPQYRNTPDRGKPTITGTPPNVKLETPPPVANHNFLSADGVWKLNLTRDFIALSTLRYEDWQSFAARLDKPLAKFIELYRPAFFQRVGLRYINFVNREALGLDGTPWSELIARPYAGPLAEEDVTETNLLNYAVDFSCKVDSSSQLKVHAGPGRMKMNRDGKEILSEPRYILDFDLSMNGQTQCTYAAGAIETLHAHALSAFEGAMTDTLRDALL